MRRARTVLLLIMTALLVTQSQQAARSRSLVINHVTIINMTGAPPAPDMVVVIASDRIAEIGKAGEIALPADAQVVDAGGQFLIPGLWDMHVHTLTGERVKLFFPVFIANGILGVRDMGSPPEELEQINRWKQETATGVLLGPRIVAAGPLVDGPEPMFPDLSIAVADEAEGRQAVVMLKRRGADFVKVYSLLSRAAYFAIADEAKQQGIPFAGHVPDSVNAGEASDAGQKSIEHLSGILLACSTREAELRDELLEARAKSDPALLLRALHDIQTIGKQTYSDDKAEKLFSQFAQNQTWQVPTLNAAWASAEGSGPNAFNLVAAMRRAGVRFMAGTDAPNPWAYPGISLHEELSLLVRAGLTPMEALQAATINPAIYLGLQDSLGSVEKGKIADLVLLEANPLEEISNTRRISGVIIRGKLIGKQGLREISAQAEYAGDSR